MGPGTRAAAVLAALALLCAAAQGAATAREGRLRSRKAGARQGTALHGIFGSLVSKVTGSKSKGSSSGSSGEKAGDTCCVVCPAAFPVELQLLELDEATSEAALRRFHSWFTASKRAGRRGFHHPHVSFLELREQLLGGASAGAHGQDRFIGGALSKLTGGSSSSKGASSSSSSAAGPSPDSAEMSMTFAGQKCCAVCPIDFIQPGSELQPALIETGASFIGGMLGGRKDDDKRGATSNVPCCEVCPAQLYPPNDLEAAMDPSFLQVGFLGGLLGGSKGDSKGAGAGDHTCCRVCADQLMQDEDEDGPALTPAKASSGGKSSGGGLLGGLFGGGDTAEGGGDVDPTDYAPPRNPANQRTDYST